MITGKKTGRVKAKSCPPVGEAGGPAGRNTVRKIYGSFLLPVIWVRHKKKENENYFDKFVGSVLSSYITKYFWCSRFIRI
ncbi:MAG: hypothetical protein MUO63_21060, partial [Desulfobulbaceae bacterium]|nr:hypothetical protein [Desulfobulbaceae bacterium]